jgi:hypothetical protein
MFAHGVNAGVVRFISASGDDESGVDLLTKNAAKIFAKRLIGSQFVSHMSISC